MQGPGADHAYKVLAWHVYWPHTGPGSFGERRMHKPCASLHHGMVCQERKALKLKTRHLHEARPSPVGARLPSRTLSG